METTKKPIYAKCPTCGKSVAWITENKWRPFCTERCKLIDLGEWLSENHRIPGKEGRPFSVEESEDFQA